MKSFCILLLIIFSSVSSYCQTDTSKADADTLAPYQKVDYIPNFSILTADSVWFFKSQLSTKKPTLILYFSPDCGHCQIETEALLSKISLLKNLQIVMVTSRPFADMKNFAQYYKLQRYRSIIIGSDPLYRISKFYDVKFTPFSAFYDKKGKFVKAYKKEIDMLELVKFLN